MLLTAKFVKGITGTYPILYDGKFQVAMLGRSNVGKSTLINSLVNKPGLARSSSHPGKTIRMDFFLVQNEFYLVDFPGYGYAARSSKILEKLSKMILWYLLYSNVTNRLAILIIDAKVGITAYDADMIKLFCEQHIDYIVVANKIDNVPANKQKAQLELIQSRADNATVLPYSSKENIGTDKLLQMITSRVHTN
jgi:GTP-binding protein